MVYLREARCVRGVCGLALGQLPSSWLMMCSQWPQSNADSAHRTIGWCSQFFSNADCHQGLTLHIVGKGLSGHTDTETEGFYHCTYGFFLYYFLWRFHCLWWQFCLKIWVLDNLPVFTKAPFVSVFLHRSNVSKMCIMAFFFKKKWLIRYNATFL